MTRIGVISDTHGFLDAKFIEFFEGCDQVWHAGDIGNVDVLTQLQSLFPEVYAVYGNIDDWSVRTEVPEIQQFTVENKRVVITHICGAPLKYNTTVRQQIAQFQPGILVCGHSHILRVQFDKKNNLLFINPGAAGLSGFHKVRTALRFVIYVDEVKDMKVMELPRRLV